MGIWSTVCLISRKAIQVIYFVDVTKFNYNSNSTFHEVCNCAWATTFEQYSNTTAGSYDTACRAYHRVPLNFKIFVALVTAYDKILLRKKICNLITIWINLRMPEKVTIYTKRHYTLCPLFLAINICSITWSFKRYLCRMCDGFKSAS